MILPRAVLPVSEISHQHKVTNITMSPRVHQVYSHQHHCHQHHLSSTPVVTDFDRKWAAHCELYMIISDQVSDCLGILGSDQAFGPIKWPTYIKFETPWKKSAEQRRTFEEKKYAATVNVRFENSWVMNSVTVWIFKLCLMGYNVLDPRVVFNR